LSLPNVIQPGMCNSLRAEVIVQEAGSYQKLLDRLHELEARHET
jgi:hypothetical protein